MLKSAIIKLSNNQNLTQQEAADAMNIVMDCGASDIQVAAFLTALKMKGETVDEITGCVSVLREKASSFTPDLDYHIDTVGTGGDSLGTFNISTTAAFIVAATGVNVAKHGNRAITSNSGSADVLESLGVNIMLDAPKVKKCVEDIGLGFMFAQTFHKSMKTVAHVRNELKIRTIFNILGPISNPSNAKGQAIGVFEPRLVNQIAHVMKNLGVENAIVMHGKDGLDEISLTDSTMICELKNNEIMEYEIYPEDFGFNRCTIDKIKGGNSAENAQILIDILSGKKSEKTDIVLLNAGVGIYVGKKANSIKEGVLLAKDILESGLALEKLNKFKEYTNEVAL